MKMVDRKEVEQTLAMEDCIVLMERALIALSTGDGKQIIRPVLPLYERNLIGMMPAYITSEKLAGVKALSVFPDNYKKNLPSHQGVIVLFDGETGSLKAVVDAESVTGIRTAAASAAATRVLAREDARKIAILGAGLQGRRHLEAISLVCNLEAVSVWDISIEAAAIYAEQMQKKVGLPVHVCSSAAEAAEDADIICTLTPSKQPILSVQDVKPGAHINAVGACSADAREICPELVAASRFFVDWKPAVMVESGDYLLAERDGFVTEKHILGEIGSVLSGELPGRTSDSDITIFEALGQAVEDVLAADFVVERSQYIEGVSCWNDIV